jgi:hypothetical protein
VAQFVYQHIDVIQQPVSDRLHSLISSENVHNVFIDHCFLVALDKAF